MGRATACRNSRIVDKLEQMFYNNCAAWMFVGDPCRFFWTLIAEYFDKGFVLLFRDTIASLPLFPRRKG
jgi:hypothetical protein